MSSPTSIPTLLGPFDVQKRDILYSKSTRYLVLDFNGEGSFGKVAKCVDLTTGQMTAIKIHKESDDRAIQREVEMLEALRGLDPEKKNIVRFMDDFKIHNLSCLAFEMLDKSLWDLMEERDWLPLSLNEIRPVIHQLLIAFEALKSIGILHTDLKPDNIMLVNHKDQPFKVKLIDFGLALPVNKVRVGMNMQACAYRAPEVTLGLPLSGAVDMWGVGCIMAFLYFADDLFPGDCAYQRMKVMVQLLGLPADHLLRAGRNTWQYFSMEEGSSRLGWRLKSPAEYKETTGFAPLDSMRFFDFARNLEHLVQSCPPTRKDPEYEDRMEFLSLLKQCLHLDNARRIKPREALKHSFVTMDHLLIEKNTSSYVADALQFMTVSPLDNLDESDDSLTNTEADMELWSYEEASDSSSDRNSFSDEDYYFDFSSQSFKVNRAGGESCIPSYSDEDDTRPATRDFYDYYSSIPSYSDEDDTRPATRDFYDYYSSIPSYGDEDAIEPATSDSYDGESCIPSYGDEDDTKPATRDFYDYYSSIPSYGDEDATEPANTDSYDYDLAIPSINDEDHIEPASTDSYDKDSSIPSINDEDNIEPASTDSHDQDSAIPSINDDDHIGPASTDSHDKDSAIPSINDEDNIEPASTDSHDQDSAIPSINDDDHIGPASTDSHDKSSAIPSYSDEDNIEPVSTESYDKDSSIPNNSDKDDTEPASTDSYDKDSAIPSINDQDNIEPGSTDSHDQDSAIPSINDQDNIEPVSTDSHDQDSAIANNSGDTHDDRVSGATGPTDGAAASISSKDGAAAAVTPVDVDEVKKKKKKNLFNRTCKFFQRVKTRVVSVFKCGKN